MVLKRARTSLDNCYIYCLIFSMSKHKILSQNHKLMHPQVVSPWTTKISGILEWGSYKAALGILWSFRWRCWSPESKSIHLVTGHLCNQMDREHVKHGCPFPVLRVVPLGIERSRGEGEEKQGSGETSQIVRLCGQPSAALVFLQDPLPTIPSHLSLLPQPLFFLCFVPLLSSLPMSSRWDD